MGTWDFDWTSKSQCPVNEELLDVTAGGYAARKSRHALILSVEETKYERIKTHSDISSPHIPQYLSDLPKVHVPRRGTLQNNKEVPYRITTKTVLSLLPLPKVPYCVLYILSLLTCSVGTLGFVENVTI